jgi:hypothetical protein
MKLWRLLLIPALALLLGALALGLRHDPKQIPSPLVGKPLPAIAGRHWTARRSIWPRPGRAGPC